VFLSFCPSVARPSKKHITLRLRQKRFIPLGSDEVSEKKFVVRSSPPGKYQFSGWNSTPRPVRSGRRN
jgi:hypothetical protein